MNSKTTKKQLRDFAVELMDEASKHDVSVNIEFQKRKNIENTTVQVTFFTSDHYNFNLVLYPFYSYAENEDIKEECLRYIKTGCLARSLNSKKEYE